MTAYRRAQQLATTLAGLRTQTFKDFEVICVEDGDDGGATRAVCQKFGALFLQRIRRPDVPYSNPAIPNNMALRRAIGEITILQNAECMYEDRYGVENLVGMVQEKTAVFATVKAMTQGGQFQQWYCHPTYRREPWFFCGAMYTKHFQYLRGFDEDYIYYGMDDVDFADRLRAAGIQFVWTDHVVLRHQWHASPDLAGTRYTTNEKIYFEKKKQMEAGTIGVVRNKEREWGEG